MPYQKLADLPDSVKELPTHAQEIYQAVFNSAFEEYKGDEEKSHATAWAAVKAK
jgi:cation transport regulator